MVHAQAYRSYRACRSVFVVVGCLAGCGGETCINPNSEGATAGCLAPTQTAAYYIDQAERYFDTLDVEADRSRVPKYSPLVARWEWPPWLLLTGFTNEDMTSVSDLLRVLDPSTVPVRDCRAFESQPFARCYVEFEYKEGRCPIYEEFVFNDAGEMTFIEAWSDLPGLRPTDGDRWGERDEFPRLSTRVPGLGNSDGRVALNTSWMRRAGEADAEVADFAQRTVDWWDPWFDALMEADENFFAQGCGWSE